MIGTLTTEEAAAEAIKLPSDFGYYGNVDLGVTWGFSGFGTHRDDDALGKANFQTFNEFMQEKYPDDVTVMGATHWAVGWSEQVLVRVYDDEGNITPAFEETLEFHHSLADYPCLDDTLMSKIEHEELIEYLNFEIPYSRVRDGVDCSDDSVAEAVAHFLFDAYSVTHTDEVTQDGLEDAYNTLHHLFNPMCLTCGEEDEEGYIAPDGSGRCRVCDVEAEVFAGDAATITYLTDGGVYEVDGTGVVDEFLHYNEAYDYLAKQASEERLGHLNFYYIDRDGTVSDLNEIGYDIDENQLTF